MDKQSRWEKGGATQRDGVARETPAPLAVLITQGKITKCERLLKDDCIQEESLETPEWELPDLDQCADVAYVCSS
jgi:hypothetical protein